jgi:hypothetical protein
MSVFFAVVTDTNIVHTTKEVKSDVIKTNEDGSEDKFSDLADHVSIANFGVCQPGDKKEADGSYTNPGEDALGNKRWFDKTTGNLMQSTYNESGQVTGEEEV